MSSYCVGETIEYPMNDLKHKMGHRVDLLLVLAALCTVAHGDTQAVGECS